MALTDFARAMKEAENAPDQMLLKEIAQDKSTSLEPLPAAIEKSRRDKMRNQSQRPTTTVLQDIAMQSQKPPMMPPGMPGQMPQGPAPQRPPGMPPQMPPGMPPQMPPAMPPQMPPAQGGIRGFVEGGLTNEEDKGFLEEVAGVFTPDAADLGLLALGATGIGAGIAGPVALIKRLGKIASLGPKAYRAYKSFLGRQAARRLPEGLSRRLAGGEGLSERVNKAIAQLSRENELVGLGGARRAQQRGFDFSGAVSDATRGATDAFQAALGRNINRGMMGGIGGAMLGSSMFGGKDAPSGNGDGVSEEAFTPNVPTYSPRDFGMPSRSFEAEINLSRDQNIADILSLGEDIQALDRYKFDKGRGFFQGGQVSGSGVNYGLLSPRIREQLEEIEARDKGFGGMGSQDVYKSEDIAEVMGIPGAVARGALGAGKSLAGGVVDAGTSLLTRDGYEYEGYTPHAIEQQESPPELIETAERIQSLPSFGKNLSPAQAAGLAREYDASLNQDKLQLAGNTVSSGPVLGSDPLRESMGLQPSGPIMLEGIEENVTESVVSDPSPQGGGASYRDYLNNIFTANKEKHDRMQRGLVLGQVASNLLSGERDFMRGLPELAFGAMDQDIRQQRDLGNVGINMLASDTGLASEQLRAKQNQVTQLLGARSQSINQLISNQEQLNRGNLFNLEARNNATANYVELRLEVDKLVIDYAAENGLEVTDPKVVAFREALEARIAPLNPSNIPTR